MSFYTPILMPGTQRVFDFVCKSGLTHITDYRLLQKGIVVADDGYYHTTEMKQKRCTNIESLRTELQNLLTVAKEVSVRFNPTSQNANITLNEPQKELLLDQLVFDVLVDKYLSEAEETTRYGYAKSMSDFHKEEYNKVQVAHRIDERLHRGMDNYLKRMQLPAQRDQLKQLGVDVESFDKYFTPIAKENSSKKKPIYVWDNLYFNFALEVTERQFARNFTREKRLYPYENTTKDLQEYLNFLDQLLPGENESPETYFVNLMRYYWLESYKRIDFIFQLIDVMPQLGKRKIDREHFIFKWFVADVMVSVEKDEGLQFNLIKKYYRPLLIIESDLQQQIQKGLSGNNYGLLLSIYQYMRAKVLELFRYHFKFTSDDYREIKQFLFSSYNLLNYHNKNRRVWEAISKVDPRQIGTDQNKWLRRIERACMEINNEAFFWPLSDNSKDAGPGSSSFFIRSI